jgi:hypothetical protein
MTKRQLERFVRIRNKSPFNNNLQFQLDASTAGIAIVDLGKVEPREGGGYQWATPHGLLIEQPNGQMVLQAS